MKKKSKIKNKMKVKKKNKIQDWQIAIFHWLLAGIVGPILFSLFFGWAVKGMAENFGVIVWLAILGEAVKFFLIWLSIIYSAEYLTKKFTIKNSVKVAGMATIFLGVSIGGFRLIFFDSSTLMNYVFSSMHIISLLVVLPFFYFFSKNQLNTKTKI